MGRCRLRIDDLPPELRAQAEAQLGGSCERVQRRPPQRAELTETERRFAADILAGLDGTVLTQAVTLRFGDGTSYTPDFVRVARDGLTAYEVKGGHLGRVAWSRHGVERFRRARDVFGFAIAFELWHYRSDGTWERLE
mgnify:CR=1 FL=1